MKQRLFSMNAIFTLLQVITVCLCMVGVLLACIPLDVGVHALMDGPDYYELTYAQWVTLLLVGFIAVSIVSLCCAAALVAFFRMCGRLKHGIAYTRKNQHTMGFIALCSLIAGVTMMVSTLLLFLLDAVGVFWIWMILCTFLFLAVATVSWALSLLVRRAVALQEEADLTV